MKSAPYLSIIISITPYVSKAPRVRCFNVPFVPVNSLECEVMVGPFPHNQQHMMNQGEAGSKESGRAPLTTEKFPI